MKSPLSYQVSEYDCGPTSVMNALSYLFDREEISPDIIKSVTMYCLDNYNDKGEAYKSGTSDSAMWFLASWLNHFARVRKFPLFCEIVSGESVAVSQNSRLMACLQQKGAVIAKVFLGEGHFVLLTGADAEFVYLFDPYYRRRPFTVPGIENVAGAPLTHNRRVAWHYFNEVSRFYYSFGKPEQRGALLLYNTRTRQTADSLDYII